MTLFLRRLPICIPIVLLLAFLFSCVDVAAEHIKLGDDFYAKGNVDAAIAEYTRASELDPTLEVQSRINKAYGKKLDLLLEASDYSNAIENGLKALAASPSDSVREKLADAYISRAWFYKSKRLNPYTLKDLTSAVEIASGYYRAYYERGRFYNNQWQHSIALIDLNKAIDINPGFAASYSERAFSYYMNQKYEKALSEANKAIELDAADARFYYTRSLVFSALKKYDLAAADLESTIRLSKDDSLAEKAAGDLKALPVSKSP